MKVLLVAVVMAAGLGQAQACRTGGSQGVVDGVEDCGTAYEKSLERYHDQDLRALQRRLDYERAKAKADEELRQLRAGNNVRYPSNPPPQPPLAANTLGAGTSKSEACRAYPAMCSSYK